MIYSSNNNNSINEFNKITKMVGLSEGLGAPIWDLLQIRTLKNYKNKSYGGKK